MQLKQAHFYPFKLLTKEQITWTSDKRYADTHSPTQTSLNSLPFSYPDNSGETKEGSLEINNG